MQRCIAGYNSGSRVTNLTEHNDDKFMDIALNYYNLLIAAQSLPDDVRVYIVNHIDLDANGDEIVKVVGGKFITEKID